MKIQNNFFKFKLFNSPRKMKELEKLIAEKKGKMQ